MRKLLPVALIFSLVLAVMAGLWLLLASRVPPRLGPTPPASLNLLPEPQPLGAFELTDHHGNRLGRKQLEGHWSLLFFGYTHCPDFCPTTLGVLKTVRDRLAAEGESAVPGVVFISVDPNRDTSRRIGEFVTYFDPTFIGATGDKGQIDALTERLGVIYSIEPDSPDHGYVVNHSANVLLIDPEGRWYANLSPPHEPDRLLAGYRRAIDAYEN